MNRFRAAAYHLAGTCVVATAVFLPIYFFWYPGALFDQAGGRALFRLIVGVHLVVGPLLVFIVFVPGKKGLVFDLVTIAVIQAAALSYGVYVLFESRPAYIVFVKDRFELVRANDLDDEELEKARPGPYATLPWTGPRLVGAPIPKDPDEQFRLMMSAMKGTDIQHFPRYYTDYGKVTAQVLARASPLARLRELNPNPDRQAGIDRLVAKLGRPEAALRFLPMRVGKHADLAVVVDAESAAVLSIAAFRPWEFQ